MAILCVTVIVKAVFFPLANQSYRSMAKMKLIQPKLAALKEQYPNDPQKQQQAQMELMRKEGVNPVAGCLPMLLADSGVLRALQGDLHHHRDAPRAVLRLDPRSLARPTRPTSSLCSG